MIAVAALTIALVSQTSASAIGDLPTYRAVYRVDRDGKNSGTAEWSLTYDAERDVYRFVSSLSAKGVLRLALPEPILERAVFRYENGAIVPTEFFYEDGTRRGEGSFYTAFDWPKNRAITIARGRRTDLEVQPGVLDRATMHVALMRDLASGEAPRTYRLADDDAIKTTATQETDRRQSARLPARSRRKCSRSSARAPRGDCCCGWPRSSDFFRSEWSNTKTASRIRSLYWSTLRSTA